jgi:hypothetical protein
VAAIYWRGTYGLMAFANALIHETLSTTVGSETVTV